MGSDEDDGDVPQNFSVDFGAKKIFVDHENRINGFLLQTLRKPGKIFLGILIGETGNQSPS